MTQIQMCSPTVTLFGAKYTYWQNKVSSKVMLINCIFTCRRITIGSYFSLCTIINYRWIKNLKLRSDTLELMESMRGNIPQFIGTGKRFLNRTLKGQELWIILIMWDPEKSNQYSKGHQYSCEDAIYRLRKISLLTLSQSEG